MLKVALEQEVFALELCALQALPHRVENLGNSERLEDEIARTRAQRRNGRIHIREGGDQHHLKGVTGRAKRLQPIEAALPREGNVQDDQIESVVLDQRRGLLGAAGGEHGVAFAAQQALQRRLDVFLVVDN